MLVVRIHPSSLVLIKKPKSIRTKIVDGTFHLKRKIKFYLEGEIKPVEQLNGRLRIIENEGTTYVVCPISDNILAGIMFPIIENYDSLE